MQTSNFRAKALVVFTIIAGLQFSVLAPPAAAKDKVQNFSSPVEAYRQGMAAYHAEDFERALPALNFAAEKGVIGAVLNLARIYANGNGTKKNDAMAFEYYAHIAQNYSRVSHRNALGTYVAEAFVAVGDYYRKGIPDANIRRNASEAIRNYTHAASHLRDPVAQYQLARMHLRGLGVRKNPFRAAQWLNLAAKQNHALSQALLGTLYWKGEGVKANKPVALALLQAAVRNSQYKSQFNKPNDRKQILGTYRRLSKNAGPEQRAKAREIFASRFNRGVPELDTDLATGNPDNLNGIIIGKTPNAIADNQNDDAVNSSPGSDILLGTATFGINEDSLSNGSVISNDRGVLRP
ncbi:MAG: tetratricopeptide repeat protein [Methyloligellaceae bacterium]